MGASNFTNKFVYFVRFIDLFSDPLIFLYSPSFENTFDANIKLKSFVLVKNRQKQQNIFLTNPYVGGEIFYKRFVLIIKNIKAFVTNKEFVGFKLKMKRR